MKDPAPALSKFQKEELDMYLNHIKYIFDKIKMNQESSDRYFNYFLLFITTPVVFLAALLSKIEKSDLGNLVDILAFICLALFLIGLCFSMAYVKFRVHKIKHTLDLIYVEYLYESKLYGNSLRELTTWDTARPYVFAGTNGDFFLSAVQILTNSFWLTLFIYLVSFTSSIIYVSIVVLLATVLQWLIRYLALRKYEAINHKDFIFK